MEKNLEPTDEQIEELHKNYIDGVRNLFEEYKDKYGTQGIELIIK